MNVTTCKYFLRGTCRYGDHCRFFHPPSSDQNFQGGQTGYYGGNRNNVYDQIQESRYKLNENVKAIEEVVKKDMVEWDKGKIWPFSCYGPCAGKPNLEGFEDLSPEELRFSTLQNNGVPPNVVALRFQQWNGARAKYQQTTQANLEALEAIILGTSKPAVSTVSSFGQGSVQINAENPTSAFGGKPFSSTPSSLFGSHPNPSAISNFSFSLNKNPVQTESMEETFGGASQGGFGSSSSSLASFSFNQAVVSPSQQQQPPVVNQGFPSLNQFQQPQTQNPMGAFSFSANQLGSHLNAGTNQFAGGNLMGGINASPFSGSSMISGQQQQLTDPNYAGLPIKGVASLSGAGDSGSSYEKTIYSALSDLTPEEIHAFESPHFDVNNLPLRAPAKKFCF